MASRGAASERMAAMAKASGFGLVQLPQGLAALAMATRQDTPSVICLVPMVWSKFLGRSGLVPSLLAAFEPATPKVASQDDEVDEDVEEEA
eukprot:7235185-Prymnesium_polylepis.1